MGSRYWVAYMVDDSSGAGAVDMTLAQAPDSQEAVQALGNLITDELRRSGVLRSGHRANVQSWSRMGP